MSTKNTPRESVQEPDWKNLFAFEEEQKRDAILFHLPESMNDYITVLARQLKHIVAKDLTDILHTNISNDMSLLPLSINEYMQQFEECDNEY